jgi:hypothetical protein
MEAMSSIFNALTDAYAALDSWRWSIGNILFWGMGILILMMGSPKTEWLVPRWFKNWVHRAMREQYKD